MNILFHANGTATCVHDESIPLAELGKLEIQRATTIEFDNEQQMWKATILETGGYFCAPTRQRCLEWERQYLENKLEHQHEDR